MRSRSEHKSILSLVTGWVMQNLATTPTMTRCVIGRTSTTSHSGCTTIRRILTIRFLAGYAEQVVRNRDMNRQHYMNKHNILDKEVLKDLSGAGFGKRAQMQEGTLSILINYGLS